jgi:pyrimidine operon attenuation protein/uracil phosphoribosyltransferase
MKKTMKVRKFALFNRVDDGIARDYSMFKLGDPKIIDRYATRLSRVIREHLPKRRESIIYTTNKYPANIYCRKNSLLLAEKIARQLGKLLIIGEYRYTPNSKKFYDDQLKRKMIHKPMLKGKRKLGRHNYHVVMVDDSIFSGLTLRTSLVELGRITDSVDFFSIINLRGSGYSEKEINDLIFNKKGVSVLVEVMKKPGYVFTSHLLRTIDKLSPNEKQRIFEKIDQKQNRRLRKAFEIYFNRKLG